MIHLILSSKREENQNIFKSCTSLFYFEERNKEKHKNHGFEEQSGSKSNIRSSYSSYAVKDLTSSYSGLRLPLPKMGFFDSVCFLRNSFY